MTEKLANKLQLKKNKCSVPIGVLNDLSIDATSWVKTTIKSRHNSFKRTLEFLVVPQIASTPYEHIDRESFDIPANITLADPEFHKPASVDILLSTGPSLAIQKRGQIRLSDTEEPDLILQNTMLGWLIGGSIGHAIEPPTARCNLVNLQTEIQQFWEIEDGITKKPISKQEIACEEHYARHVTRNEDGRYIVALPFNNKREEIGQTYNMAKKRLLTLERRLHRDPELKRQYTAVIDEYRTLGHMKPVNNEKIQGFYLPHHAVIKESSLTTKVRVVFDGSAQSSTKISLNEALLVGPTIQPDIFTLVLRFRLYNYVLTGDIEKMYRQVLIRPEDRKYQRILWKNDDNEITTYELQTVTFGLASAPFLAIRTLHQLAADEGHQYPLAAKILTQDLYVDDVLTGAQTKETAIKIRDELQLLLRTAGFNLRQCASNSKEILQGLPDCVVSPQLITGNDQTLKTLGIRWDSQQDKIIYTVNPIATRSNVTMRTIASDVARIFDPLGLLNPVVVYAKLIKQELWRLALHWDDAVPLDIETKWEQFASQLSILNGISFNRKLLHFETTNIELHGFCDASEKAYGACIYLKSTNLNGNVRTNLFCAKSRIAPLKTKHTIPRLELCAAFLLAQLYDTVKSSIELKIDRTTFWTDSTVTLHWINTEHQRLQTFVSNRVKEIQNKTNFKDWRHVRTHDNPADMISRGQLPQEFKNQTLWSHGPSWLTRGDEFWPTINLTFPSQPEESRKEFCMTMPQQINTLLNKYSTFRKLQRVTAMMMRVFKVNRTGTPLLSSTELQAAIPRILRWTQQTTYNIEIDLLKRGQPVQRSSKLANLNPFLDDNGVIRVGGRLERAEHLTYDQKHPIVLPKSHSVTELLIRQEHEKGLHSGIQTTLYNLRQKYWPTDGRNQVKKVIRNCVTCTRANPPTTTYLMGNLPKERITAARPFLHTGIDYCGPFWIKEKEFRNRKKIKVYIALFVCLATKAVHIEVVGNMTTEAFLSALKRFISRRGICSRIFTDNGTNFVGANNELKELYALQQSTKHNERVYNELATKNITWHFIPPQSPNFGGLWEAAVKSCKHHLKRVMGTTLLTYEQFNSLCTNIEAILNSRPLTPLSSDPNDFLPLTPAHFLIGESLTNIPEPDFLDVSSNRLSSWEVIQKLKQQFWARWHKEYLNQLHIRHKWSKGGHGIEEGTLVLLRDDHLSSLEWRLGRITKVYPGTDGIIRAADVKTTSGILRRNIRKLSPLPAK